MPNRKTFDEREKYDHSQHSLAHREAGDLAAAPPAKAPAAARKSARVAARPDRGQTRNSR